MRSHVLMGLTFVFVTSWVSAQHCRSVDIGKSTGLCTVPDHALTPVEMDALEKKAILAAYGYRPATDESTGEFDHWFPHWMGGSDGPKNIWFEPHAGKFGSFQKRQGRSPTLDKSVREKDNGLDQAKTLYLRGWTKLLPQP